MPIYKCEKCKKEFNRKSGYASHIIRIKPCINDNNINNECEYCNKNYSTRFNLNAHLKNCKKNPIIDHTQQQIEELKKMLFEQQKKFEEQQKDNQELKKKVEELSHVSETNNNITLNENSHNTTNNTINIYSSGKEDLSRLSKEDILKLCTSGTYYPIVAAEILHCNEKYPKHIYL